MPLQYAGMFLHFRLWRMELCSTKERFVEVYSTFLIYLWLLFLWSHLESSKYYLLYTPVSALIIMCFVRKQVDIAKWVNPSFSSPLTHS